jgi:hypothetical protein
MKRCLAFLLLAGCTPPDPLVSAISDWSSQRDQFSQTLALIAETQSSHTTVLEQIQEAITEPDPEPEPPEPVPVKPEPIRIPPMPAAGLEEPPEATADYESRPASVVLFINRAPNCPHCERMKREAPDFGFTVRVTKGSWNPKNVNPCIRFQTDAGDWKAVWGWEGEETADLIRDTISGKDAYVRDQPQQYRTEYRTVTKRVAVYPTAVPYGGRMYASPPCGWNARDSMCRQIAQMLRTPTYVDRQVRVAVRVPIVSQSVPEPPVQQLGQEPSSPESIDTALRMLDLSSSDVFADIGCGDGRVLIAAVRQYNVRRAVGIEIDPIVADAARRSVRRAVESGTLSPGRVAILTGDAADFDPEAWGVTAAYAFLFPETLSNLRSVLNGIPRVVCPYHQIPGAVPSREQADIYLYENARFRQPLEVL